jgi:hypothetical protein
MCSDALIRCEQAVGQRVAKQGRSMRRVFTGTPLPFEQTVGERVANPGRRVRQVCPGTLVHRKQTIRLM